MNDNVTDRGRLSEAVGKTVDRFTRKHPTLTVIEVCAALGVVAGTVAGVNVPAGNPEADILVGSMLGTGFGEALKAARALKVS